MRAAGARSAGAGRCSKRVCGSIEARRHRRVPGPATRVSACGPDVRSRTAAFRKADAADRGHGTGLWRCAITGRCACDRRHGDARSTIRAGRKILPGLRSAECGHLTGSGPDVSVGRGAASSTARFHALPTRRPRPPRRIGPSPIGASARGWCACMSCRRTVLACEFGGCARRRLRSRMHIRFECLDGGRCARHRARADAGAVPHEPRRIARLARSRRAGGLRPLRLIHAGRSVPIAPAPGAGDDGDAIARPVAGRSGERRAGRRARDPR